MYKSRTSIYIVVTVYIVYITIIDITVHEFLAFMLFWKTPNILLQYIFRSLEKIISHRTTTTTLSKKAYIYIYIYIE